jgi:hypothetical protein
VWIYIVVVLAPVVLAGVLVARARRGNPGDLDHAPGRYGPDERSRDPYAAEGDGHF